VTTSSPSGCRGRLLRNESFLFLPPGLCRNFDNWQCSWSDAVAENQLPLAEFLNSPSCPARSECPGTPQLRSARRNVATRLLVPSLHEDRSTTRTVLPYPPLETTMATSPNLQPRHRAYASLELKLSLDGYSLAMQEDKALLNQIAYEHRPEPLPPSKFSQDISLVYPPIAATCRSFHLRSASGSSEIRTRQLMPAASGTPPQTG
jgi:hypothetical protein